MFLLFYTIIVFKQISYCRENGDEQIIGESPRSYTNIILYVLCICNRFQDYFTLNYFLVIFNAFKLPFY